MRYSLRHTRGYRTHIYGELSQLRGLARRLARRSRDHNTMFYRVLLGIIIIILLEISCDSRDSRQDSKDSGKIRRFQRDSWSCRHDSESCRTPRYNHTSSNGFSSSAYCNITEANQLQCSCISLPTATVPVVTPHV